VKTHTHKLLTIPVRLGLALLIAALAAPTLTAAPVIGPGERGSITISAVTDPPGGQGLKFGGDLGSFALDDGAFRQFKDLEAGEYQVYEKAPEGWTLDEIVCKGNDGEEHDVKDDYAGGDRNSVAVKLGPGEHVACIFYNSKDAGIILDQTALAGGTGLEFDGGLDDSALSPVATTTVDTTVDELDGRCDDGDCSLRDAILLADPGDTIVIPAGIYTLALGHLVVDKDLTLAGAGADVAIIQAAAEPNVANLSVVEVYQANGTITVGISGLTLRHGGGPDDVDPGGGLMNQGEDVILSHSAVAFNSGYYAGGIRNNGGSMIIQNCAVYGNTEGSNAGGGGGIYNSGAMTIANSTISGNQVLGFDGERADGGGIRHAGGSLTLDNVTITGNVSTRYGGGVFASPGLTVTVRNSIIAGNFSLDTITPTMDCSGPFYSAGYNLIGDDTGCTGFTDGVNGDRVGVDPLLATLADNGGPTPTRALYDGSPAIDNGSCSDTGGNPVTADQRGVSRPQGSGCDIGALEAVPPAPSAPPPDPVGVNTTVDELDGRCDDGDCSLRDAVLLADPGDTITIPAGIYTLALGHLVVDKDLTLAGAGADVAIIQAAAEPNVANWPVVEVYQENGTVTATISGLTLRHGGGPDDVDPGGGLMNQAENVILSHSAVAFNSGSHAGGIHNNGGSVIIQNCAVYGNTEGSNGYGGGIYNSGAMTVTNSTISGNQVLSYDGERADGGGIRHAAGSLTLDNVTVGGNVSTRYGGGVFANTGLTVTVRNSIIAGNFSLDTISPTLDCSGHFYSAGYNLIGDDTGCTGFMDGVNGDRVGVDPLLAGLADNGGPTPTRALYDGSPAIDNGSCSDTGGNPVTADQRGISRPQGSGCDVGALESGPPDLVISKSVAPTTAAPGQAVTYTLTFSNAGVGIATGIVITDIVPVTITGVSAISSGVAIVDPGATPPYVWQVQELAALNRGGVITITGMVSPGLSADCVFTNTATITTTMAEQNPADNHHQVPLGAVVPRVQFSDGAYDVSEGGGATVITVTLDAPNVYAGVTVSYTTTDGTAVAGEDYTATGGSVTIPAGSTYVTFSVTIADDQVDEAAETVLLSLSDPSGGALDAPSDATLTILDNDSRVYLPLVTRSYATSE
jgi:uncharacterized repeat protein (TIGR01451 family)/CSLREA domain-containing protein